MNIKFFPKYWFANKETRFNLLLDQQYPKDCFEKAKAKLDREFPTKSEKDLDVYKLRLNELEYNYKLKDEYEFEHYKLGYSHLSDKEYAKESLELEYKFGKIKEIDYMKEKADLDGKPFVAVRPDFDEVDGDNFYFDIIFNEIFIEKLKKQGYSGDTDNDIVDQWLKWKMINSFDNIEDLIENKIPTNISKIDVGDGKKLYK